MGSWPWAIPAVAVPVGSGLMLGVAAFSATRAIRLGATFRTAFRVEVSHLLMAIGMAGMLAPRYAVLPAAAWTLTYFGMSTLARHGEHHVMANGAMTFMWGAACVNSADLGGIDLRGVDLAGTGAADEHAHAAGLDVGLSVAAAAMLLYLVLRAIRLVRASPLFSRTEKITGTGHPAGWGERGRECVMNLTMALMLLPMTLGPVAGQFR